MNKNELIESIKYVWGNIDVVINVGGRKVTIERAEIDSDGKIVLTPNEILYSESEKPSANEKTQDIVCKKCGFIIARRLSGGRINKAKKGGFAGGGVALGYIGKNKDLEIEEENAETIRRIFYMKERQRKGLRLIARELNANGIPTSRGGKWYAGTVKYILENPIYKGNLVYKNIATIRGDLTIL